MSMKYNLPKLTTKKKQVENLTSPTSVDEIWVCQLKLPHRDMAGSDAFTHKFFQTSKGEKMILILYRLEE